MKKNVFIGMILAAFSLSIGISAKDIKIGVLAKRGAKKCLKKWGPMAAYLSKKLNTKVRIIPLKFTATDPAIKNKKVDFILCNSSMFCNLQKKYGLKTVATMINSRKGKALHMFGGVIFVRKDSPIKTLEDIKGKKFACVKKSSFGGYQMALRELKEHGINPEKDCSKFIEAGKHDNVVFAVLNGVVDVGTVRTDTIERMEAEKKCKLSDFRILNPMNKDFPFVCSTRLYPEWPIGCLKDTPKSIVEKMKSALISMPKDSNAAKAAKIVGWKEPADYSSVIACLKELGIGEFGKKKHVASPPK